MPEQIYWDTANDSQLEEFGPNAFRAVRAGAVHDVPVSPGDTADDFLFKVRRILNANGIVYNSTHPKSPNSYLTRINIFGSTNDSATFRLTYEPFQTNNGSVLQVTSSFRKALVITDRVPGTGAMLRVSLNIPGDPIAIPEDLLKLGVIRSQRVISVFKVNIGTLPLANIIGDSETMDCVNEGVWCGRPTGGWRLDEETTSTSRYAGNWIQQLAAVAAGRKDEVWDSVGILQSSVTGKYAMSQKVFDALQDSLNRPYKFGIITATTNPVSYTVPGLDIPITLGGKFDKGHIRAGMYPTRPFAPIFGFGAEGSPFSGNQQSPNVNPQGNH